MYFVSVDQGFHPKVMFYYHPSLLPQEKNVHQLNAKTISCSELTVKANQMCQTSPACVRMPCNLFLLS